ncbi:MAG: hypothetical protein IE927_16455 [Rhodobacterales bacterium]|nr:hypothetical protein [Rhodobacterales bacterium]
MLDLAPERPATARDALSDAVVTTRGLRKSYDRRTEILKGIDLTIRQGERVALIGSNGCGVASRVSVDALPEQLGPATLPCFGRAAFA